MCSAPKRNELEEYIGKFWWTGIIKGNRWTKESGGGGSGREYHGTALAYILGDSGNTCRQATHHGPHVVGIPGPPCLQEADLVSVPIRLPGQVVQHVPLDPFHVQYPPLLAAGNDEACFRCGLYYLLDIRTSACWKENP